MIDLSKLAPLTAPSALSLALTLAVIIVIVVILWLGTKPAYWLARVTTDAIKDKRALATIRTGVAWAEQAIPNKSDRLDKVIAFVCNRHSWLSPLDPWLQPAIEAAVLQLHKDLGVYDAQLAGAAGAAQQLDLSLVQADLHAAATQAGIAAGESAARDALKQFLAPLLGGAIIAQPATAVPTARQPEPLTPNAFPRNGSQD